MATSKDLLRERLGRYREITIRVIGRKSGRKISIPVWFVLEGRRFTCCRCRGRSRSGIGMWWRIR